MDLVLIGVGLAALLAGITGGGLTAAGVEVPVLRTATQGALLAITGLAISLLGLYVYYDQRPTAPIPGPADISAVMEPVGIWSGTCPANLELRGSITIREGKGTVRYHAYLELAEDDNVASSTTQEVYFSGPGTQRITDTVLFSEGVRSSGNAYWMVESPALVQSNASPYAITCH